VLVAATPASVGEWILVAFVVLGSVPLFVAAVQYLLVGLHRWRNHYDDCADFLPNVAVLIPAWNEAAVLDTTIEQLVRLEYPKDRLRIYVVDDASTDCTPELLARKALEHPGQVFSLRREKGGEGKSHTLNHGLRIILGEDWMQALLIMDADVVYEPDSLRKMTRHLADPDVGAVTAYIKEGSDPARTLNRFIGYEYITAQAAARRTQNVLGVLACLAGGAQLHSRANLEALGGQIDTTSLAEDTFTTFETQIRGRSVVFEPNATVWAEEPADVGGLWKQRLRWARGNVQVTRRYKGVWFRPRAKHHLGSFFFGMMWFSTTLLPLIMILSSAALTVLWFVDRELSRSAFRWSWIINALCYVFVTTYALLLDGDTAKKVWRQAIMFPGLISVLIIVWSCFPALFRWGGEVITDATGWSISTMGTDYVMLAVYVWVAACMLAAALCKWLDGAGAHRVAVLGLYVSGFGPLLCAITFTAYVKELRGAEQVWEKTEKTGKVLARA
jgi:cellulose synthase/poly-beta-1,6-N-acetylglucosamine synthase-like glycosyltransferase